LRCLRSLFLLLLILCATQFALAQSTDATISGLVLDPSGKVIPDADIEILNESTSVHYSGKTNGSGIYMVSILPPGEYRVQVSKFGFKTLIKPGVVLNVQSAVALNFTLPLGATSESVTVNSGTSSINTTDGSVSTVIDSKFDFHDTRHCDGKPAAVRAECRLLRRLQHQWPAHTVKLLHGRWSHWKYQSWRRVRIPTIGNRRSGCRFDRVGDNPSSCFRGCLARISNREFQLFRGIRPQPRWTNLL